MHNDILEAKIRAAKVAKAMKGAEELRMRGDDMCADLYNAKAMRLELAQMLAARKAENMQRISRHEENEKNLTKALEEYCVTDPVHAGRQLANAISKQNELLAQVELIDEIERYMKGQEV